MEYITLCNLKENIMAKISVIIPVYNVKKYLRDCLDSVTRQTITDIEIICIDDGSTDGSLDILNEYSIKDERFVILNQPNQGVSVSRNNGLEVANGDYVAFVDSDDYLLNNDYLEKLYNACEKHNADIAVASIIRGNEKKSKYLLNIEKEEVTTDYVEKLNLCDLPNLNYVWNKLYRRKSLLDSKIKFPEGVYYEDIVVTHKYLHCLGKIVTVPKIAYFYRKNTGSIVTIKTTKAMYELKKAETEMYKFLLEHDVDINMLLSHQKKYKVLGLTLYKTITKNKRRKNVLFNLIKWNSIIGEN